jgi:hypothetical protein
MFHEHQPGMFHEHQPGMFHEHQPGMFQTVSSSPKVIAGFPFFVPRGTWQQITSACCVMTQKSAVLSTYVFGALQLPGDSLPFRGSGSCGRLVTFLFCFGVLKLFQRGFFVRPIVSL